MIQVTLPKPELRHNGLPFAAPHRRLMAAVMQTVVDDCRSSTCRRAPGYPVRTDRRNVHQALAYVASTDRAWPFSFENLCEALSLDAGRLRQEFHIRPSPRSTLTMRLARQH